MSFLANIKDWLTAETIYNYHFQKGTGGISAVDAELKMTPSKKTALRLISYTNNVWIPVNIQTKDLLLTLLDDAEKFAAEHKPRPLWNSKESFFSNLKQMLAVNILEEGFHFCDERGVWSNARFISGNSHVYLRIMEKSGNNKRQSVPINLNESNLVELKKMITEAIEIFQSESSF